MLEQVRRGTLLGEVAQHFDVDLWRRVVDVGCGASARNAFFAQRNWRREAIGVDISLVSLRRACERIEAPVVNGSVLALPFCDGVFDFAMSTGVIHHTANPRKALGELRRILRPGGGLFLSVYNRRSIYRPIYRYLGGLARGLERHRMGLLVKTILLPLYYVAYTAIVWAATGRISRVPFRQAKADFHDKLLHPHVLFIPPAEIEEWIRSERAECLKSSAHMAGLMVGFLIRA